MPSSPAALSSSPQFLALAAYLSGGLTGGCNVLTSTLLFDTMSREEAQLVITGVYPLFGVGVIAGPVIASTLHTLGASYALPMGCAGLTLATASAISLTLAWHVARARRAKS